MLANDGVPVLRGLRPGLVALHNLGIAGQRHSAKRQQQGIHRPRTAAAEIHTELTRLSGPLPANLIRKVLTTYDIPVVRSAIVPDIETAVVEAATIGYPLVVKVASPDIVHRSDIGGVELGIPNAAALREALARINARVTATMPEARISGFELQEYLADHIEAMVGFVAAPPFGALLTVGTGGTMVELQGDRCVDTSELIAATRLGATPQRLPQSHTQDRYCPTRPPRRQPVGACCRSGCRYHRV
jgi:acetyltransferase